MVSRKLCAAGAKRNALRADARPRPRRHAALLLRLLWLARNLLRQAAALRDLICAIRGAARRLLAAAAACAPGSIPELAPELNPETAICDGTPTTRRRPG